MGRSNLIPITKIYDIYPKYTYSDGVKKFMDEIVDIDRANVYTKEEVIALFKDIQLDVEGQKFDVHTDKDVWNDAIRVCSDLIQQKINSLRDRENEG